jgi:hypothetical protein
MANTDITFNCLITPSGSFNTLSLDRVSITITVPRNETVSTLKTAVQTELTSYNNTPLDIYYPESVDEKRMQTQVLIFAYFK